jgi:hypothetical protein
VLVAEPAGGAVQELRAGRAALVGQYLDVGQAGVVVDRDVAVVPAVAAAADGLAAAVHAPAAAVGDPTELLDVHVQQIARTGVLVALIASAAAAQHLTGDAVDVGQVRHAAPAQHRADGAGGQAQQHSQLSRADMLGPAGRHDALLDLDRGTGRAGPRAAAAVAQTRLALSLEPSEPLVDAASAHPELLGDLTDLVTGPDALDEQQPGVRAQTGISVRHEGPPGDQATSDTATPAGGPSFVQAATPSVTNVPGRYT